MEILTRNSAATLRHCLESVKNFDEIIILDGNSTDDTLKIAAEYGCRIVKQYETEEKNVAIKNYAEVRNKGLKRASHEWFMFIDSDEYLSPEVADEIQYIVSDSNPKTQVFWQPRKYVLDGNIIECATTYPNQQIRLFHKKWVKEFIKPVHERIELRPNAQVGWLKNYEYVPVGDLADLKRRWKRYTDFEIAMAKTAPRKRIWRNLLKHIGLLGLYTIRYVRGWFLCRGPRMPLRFEYARHRHEIILIFRLFLMLIYLN